MARNNLPEPRPKTIHDAYFEWLYRKVFDVWDYNSDYSYTTVCWYMHEIVFTPLVEGDDNRVADAAGLRNEFQRFAGSLGPEELNDLMLPDASIFEVLIALADRAELMVPLTRKIWFQKFIENLGLDKFSDKACQNKASWPIERNLNIFNNRQYSRNGRGGLFPRRQPEEDQTKVELWYQMGKYMTENAMY
jgi:hypothetical protein